MIPRLHCPWGFQGKNTWVGSYFLLQGNLPYWRIKPMSSAWQVNSLPLSHLGMGKSYAFFPNVQNPRYHMPFSCHISLVSFNLGQFSLLCYFWSLTTLVLSKGTGQLFHKMFLNFSSSDFLLVRLVLYIFIKSNAKVQFCPSQYIVSGGTCCWHVFLLVMFISITESGRCQVFLL